MVVTIALLTGFIWVLCDSVGLPLWASALIAFAVGYTVRVLALYYAWEEPLAKEPKGVYIHDDGRPMLGRKLKGKSKREMAYLGLTVNDADGKDGANHSERASANDRDRRDRRGCRGRTI